MQTIRKTIKTFYITFIIILAVTTLAALYDGGYGISSGVIAGIAFLSIITSLLPYFISMNYFRKYELNPVEKKHLKVYGLIIYVFCFPVKGLIIYSNIALLITGGDGWAFG